jgi:hypothetical protein
VRKGTGADPGASGATRISGSLNFKEKYAPDYPRVGIHAAQPGRTTTTDELEQLGLAAPPEEFAPVAPALSTNRHWPSYDKALDGALEAGFIVYTDLPRLRAAQPELELLENL